jgi:hypothetical protein
MRKKEEKEEGRGALQVLDRDGWGVASNIEAGGEASRTRRREGKRDSEREKMAGRKIRRLNESSPLRIFRR